MSFCLQTRSLPRSCSARAERSFAVARPRSVVARASNQTLTPPSSATGATELKALQALSEVVPDSLGFDSPRLKAATVCATSLLSVLASASLGLKPYENAIAAGLSYDRCRAAPTRRERAACAMDKALVNVGAMLVSRVGDGRICTEVDPRLAHDTGKLVAKAHTLVKLYEEVGVAKDRLIFRLPATWEGTQAAKQLEAEGVATQLFLLYSVVQGVAAMQAGVSVLQPNVGRVRDWYTQHPGVIRNPKGPREDSGAMSSIDPGVELVKQLYAYAQKFHPKTRVMASGIRTRADALALAGCDYLVLSARVMDALAAQTSTQGYNDGLHAADAGSGMTAALSPSLAASMSDVVALESISEAAWKAGLGLAGEELLKRGLDSQVKDVQELLQALEQRSGGSE